MMAVKQYVSATHRHMATTKLPALTRPLPLLSTNKRFRRMLTSPPPRLVFCCGPSHQRGCGSQWRGGGEPMAVFFPTAGDETGAVVMRCPDAMAGCAGGQLMVVTTRSR